MPGKQDDQRLASAGTLGSRNTRSAKMPDSVYKDIMQNPERQNYWFDLFQKNNCEWSSVQVFENVSDEHTEDSGRTKGWVTRGQAATLFNSKAVADALCDEAKKQPHLWRPHPDCKWLEEATLYYILKDESTRDGDKKKQERGVSYAADVDGDGEN
eukprot:2551141-Alexandrium_andersonii.AAC.1